MKEHTVPAWKACCDQWQGTAREDQRLQTAIEQANHVVALVETLCEVKVEGPAHGDNSTCDTSSASVTGTFRGSSQSGSTTPNQTVGTMPRTSAGSAPSSSASGGGTGNPTTGSKDSSDQV
jgi:hypothetical protein